MTVMVMLGLLALGSVLGQPGATSAGSYPVDDGAFAALEPQGSGRTFYVSGDGDDAKDGLSETEAFATLQHAADQTAPGDTVLVLNGTYSRSETGGNVLKVTTSGEPDNWIQYRAYPNHTPVVRSKNNYAGAARVPHLWKRAGRALLP